MLGLRQSSAQFTFAGPIFKNEGLVRDAGYLNCSSLRVIIQPHLTFEELMKTLGAQRAVLGTDTVRPVSQCDPRLSSNTMDLLVWIRQMARLPCSMTQVHQIYECPTPIVTMQLKSQFLPQLQIYVANNSTFRIKYDSGPVSNRNFHRGD